MLLPNIILGICIERGEGVKQDYKKAVEWFQKAADQGYASAQYNLGLRYANGPRCEAEL